MLVGSMVTLAAPVDLRPAFHFTAPSGWLNDPNGLVFKDGIYHLFYQHNPHGIQWGNMTWGHATSTDLFHWKHEPYAIEPDTLGTIFSGSAVIDHDNTAGFGKDAMVCFYTAAGGTNEASKGKPFTQCLAWSADGRNFTKLESNPIVPHLAGENRDPKVVWHDGTKKWIMALYLEGDQYCFLGSKDLRNWEQLSRFNLRGSGECPDLIRLPLDGDAGKQRWVFWGANGNYQVGEFDGKEFHPSTGVQRSDFGNTGYAAQTYSNAPSGRHIQIAWMRGSEIPGAPWNQQMGMPNELSLRSTSTGPKLFFMPVPEVSRLQGREVLATDGLFAVSSGLFDFEGAWKLPKSGVLRLNANGTEIRFDAESRCLSVLDRMVQIPAMRDLKLRILADRTTLEIYAQDGEVYLPMFVIPTQNTLRGIQLFPSAFSKGSVKVHELAP